MKRLVNSILLLLMGIAAFSQSIERQVISSGGAMMQSSDAKISSTIGEALDENYMSGSFKLYQGFQQANDTTIASEVKKPSISVEYKIYPNPVNNNLFVEYTSDKKAEVTLKLFSSNGRLLESEQIQSTKGSNRLTIDFSTYASGMYKLIFMNKSGKILESRSIEKLE